MFQVQIQVFRVYVLDNGRGSNSWFRVGQDSWFRVEGAGNLVFELSGFRIEN